jgi:phosphoglycolate phosphatase
MVDAILFDLDGTLIDTAPEIADAVNATLRRAGHGPATLEQVRGWIGDGARATLTKALSAAGVRPSELPTQVLRAWPGFELDYQLACGTTSSLFPGVRALLQRLQAADVRCAMVTNKESTFSHRLLVRHDLTGYFDVLVCGDTLPLKKPDPAPALHALAALGVPPERALFVGDSAHDVACARAAGVPVWLVRHGYGLAALDGDHAPDRFIARLDEVGQALTDERDTRISIF